MLDEINLCKEGKRAALYNYLAEIDYVLLVEDDEIDKIAKIFVENGVLKEKNIDDCYHLAFAMKYDCDVLVSWNFKHLVHIDTIKGVKVVSGITGYQRIEICSPPSLI